MSKLQTRKKYLIDELEKREKVLDEARKEYDLINIELTKLRKDEKEKEDKKRWKRGRAAISGVDESESESESESEKEEEEEEEEEGEEECSECGEPYGCSKCPKCYDTCCNQCYITCQKCDTDGMDIYLYCPDCSSICLGCNEMMCASCLEMGGKCEKCNCSHCNDCMINDKECNNCLAKSKMEARKRKREEDKDKEEENRPTKVRKFLKKNKN